MHNAVRDILWRFVKEHIDPNALREQRLEALRAPAATAAKAEDEEEDRLDLCFSHAGKQYNVDVAIVGARNDDTRVRAHASTDGVAAREEEQDKRRRYAGLAILPCVFETGGRAGDSAQALVRMLARLAAGEDEAPAMAALLWQRISHGLQTAACWQLATAVVRHGHLATVAA